MNSTGEFKTIEGSEDQDSENKMTLFGISMTPTILGILLGLLGVGAFFYIWSTYVSPVLEAKKQLETDKQTKDAQLQQLKTGQIDQQIREIQAQLDREKILEPEVLGMFSDEKTLDTLLLDLSNSIESNQAQLITFLPQDTSAVQITDGSLGELVNYRLKRKSNNVTIRGTFEETKAAIQDIERLQPLLLIKDFSTAVVENPTYRYSNGQIIVTGQPILESTFKIDAILPEDPANIPQPAPPAEGQPPAQP